MKNENMPPVVGYDAFHTYLQGGGVRGDGPRFMSHITQAGMEMRGWPVGANRFNALNVKLPDPPTHFKYAPLEQTSKYADFYKMWWERSVMLNIPFKITIGDFDDFLNGAYFDGITGPMFKSARFYSDHEKIFGPLGWPLSSDGNRKVIQALAKHL